MERKVGRAGLGTLAACASDPEADGLHGFGAEGGDANFDTEQARGVLEHPLAELRPGGAWAHRPEEEQESQP